MDDLKPIRLLRPVTLPTTAQPAFRVSACASRVALDGVETIDGTVTVVLLSPPDPSTPIRLDAPRDSIRPRQCFALRYFMKAGARRALLVCTGVTPAPGMRDLVTAKLADAPVPAGERDTHRKLVDVELTARVIRSALVREYALVGLTAIDISATGLGFHSSAQLSAGDLIVLQDPVAGRAAAGLEIVRRTADGQFGGRFTDAQMGASYCHKVVTVHREHEEAERRARRREAMRGTEPLPEPEPEAKPAGPAPVVMYTRETQRQQQQPAPPRGAQPRGGGGRPA